MSLRAFGLAAAFVALMPVAAWAHGPTRQKYIDTIEINAPADKVWAVVGNFSDMSWNPMFAKTEAKGGNDVGATRDLISGSGSKIVQKLVKYDATKMALQYEVMEIDVKLLPVSGYESWLTVTPDGSKSKVEWKGKFYRAFVNNDPPPELNDDAALAAVTIEYRKGLEALKAKIEGGK